MTISGGTRLGSYEFVDSLGVGGMGEVYRAKDLKLKRDVAIKVLPESLAADTDRLARFQREAEILASLNHANIAQIYGLEKTDGITGLVMELIDGPTLAERIQQGPLPLDETLNIALQLAEALEAAHQRGIVHRDLKPANIKLRANGAVKVLDFGIAKAFDTNTGHSGPQSPVLTTPAMTMSGMILGTAAYMSPEQARGKIVDQRTDIWAFGCVLYEMLTGQPAFGGEDVQETLARVITNTTDLKSLPVTATPAVRQALELCLEKDPNKRIADIRDVKLVLKGRLGTTATAPVSTISKRNRASWLVAGLATTVIAALASWWLKPETEQAPASVVRFDFALNAGQTLRNNSRDVLAISPDGSQIVYNTNAGLFVRAIGESEGRLIPGTQQDMTNPFFSPDGAWIGFWDATTTQLKKIPAAGGSAVVLTPATNITGASWHPDGSRIIFGQASAGLMEVAANGGEPSLLIPVTDGILWDPQYLPNGALLFSAAVGIPEIRIQLPGSGEALLSFPGERAVYTATGHLLVTDPFAAPTALFARTINLETLALGGPVPVAANAVYNGSKTHFAISTSGTLISVYGVPGVNTGTGTQPDLYLTRINRDGMQERLNAPARPYRSPRLSPDGTQVAVEIINSNNNESSIWVYDLAGDTDIRRLTQVSEGNNLRPVWTLDGQQLAFMSDRDGAGSIFVQAADGSSPAQRLTSAEEGTFHIPESWAPDGSLSFGLIVGNFGASSWGVHTRNPAGEVAAFHDLETGNQFASAFSPDGNWLAYSSGENSTEAQAFRIYVERYPKTGERYEVAVEGATYPVWSHDGTELFYRRGLGTQPRTLNSVTILETEPRFRFSTTNSVDIGGFLNHQNYRDFDPFPDGSGWLMLTPMVDQNAALNAGAPAIASQRIDVVLNWFQELEQRVPTAQ